MIGERLPLQPHPLEILLELRLSRTKAHWHPLLIELRLSLGGRGAMRPAPLSATGFSPALVSENSVMVEILT